MRRLGPVRPWPIGTFTVSGNTLRLGENVIPLDKLPIRNGDGPIGMLVRLVGELTATFGTLASDPTVPSYLLDSTKDVQLESVDGKVWINRKGYMEPIREYDRHGTLRNEDPIAADLPATGAGGAGAYARTITRKIDFLEPSFGDLDWFRLLPCTYFRGGRLVYTIKPGPIFLNGATVSIPATAQLKVTAYVRDWLLPGQFPIALDVTEGYGLNDGQDVPSPGGGAFLRWLIANSPAVAASAAASTPPADDFDAITKLTVGPVNGPFVHNGRLVSELMKKYMQGSRDERPAFTSGAPVYQSQFRFPDSVDNADGRMKYIPLIVPPRVGAQMHHIQAYGTSPPRIVINDDNRAGTPGTITHIYDKVNPRTDETCLAILGSMGMAQRFRGQRAHVIGKGNRPEMTPLMVNVG